MTYYGCPICQHSATFLYHPGQIVLVLRGEMPPYLIVDDILEVNGLLLERWMYFDQLLIEQASDEDVERCVVKLINASGPDDKVRYRQLGCRVKATCNLSANTKRILEDMFGSITPY